MPVRTVVEEFCDVCFVEDDQETPAAERFRFSWQGRDYLLLACETHAGPIKDQFEHLAGVATPARGPGTARPPSRTLFSGLADDEKARFRAWAGLPNARRIADARVEAWMAAGRP